MGARVQIENGPDGLVLVYVRYHVKRRIHTGTHDLAEADRMAVALTEDLEAEQREKALRRPDWRPEGVEAPPPVQMKPKSAPFNPPRVG